MKSLYDEGSLTLFLKDRIKSDNAPRLREEAFDLLKEYKPEKVVCDCEALQYISSSGLRVLLEIGKAYKLSVINVSAEVYEILDLSGFTNMDEFFD